MEISNDEHLRVTAVSLAIQAVQVSTGELLMDVAEIIFQFIKNGKPQETTRD